MRDRLNRDERSQRAAQRPHRGGHGLEPRGAGDLGPGPSLEHAGREQRALGGGELIEVSPSIRDVGVDRRGRRLEGTRPLEVGPHRALDDRLVPRRGRGQVGEEGVRTLMDTESQPIDAAVSARAATIDMISELQQAGPYGSGNPDPVFVLPNHRVRSSTIVGNGHVKVSLQSTDNARLDAIAFRAAETELGKFLTGTGGNAIHVAGSLSINHWNGRQTPQMRIIDAAAPV